MIQISLQTKKSASSLTLRCVASYNEKQSYFLMRKGWWRLIPQTCSLLDRTTGFSEEKVCLLFVPVCWDSQISFSQLTASRLGAVSSCHFSTNDKLESTVKTKRTQNMRKWKHTIRDLGILLRLQRCLIFRSLREWNPSGKWTSFSKHYEQICWIN